MDGCMRGWTAQMNSDRDPTLASCILVLVCLSSIGRYP
jgi:hypothetical protein